MDLVIGKVPGQTSREQTKKQNPGGSFPLNPDSLYIFFWALFRHGVFLFVLVFACKEYLERLLDDWTSGDFFVEGGKNNRLVCIYMHFIKGIEDYGDTSDISINGLQIKSFGQ